MKAAEYFTLPPSLEAFASHFEAHALPWEWIKQIAPALESYRFEEELPTIPAGVSIENHVYIHPTVKLPAYATIIGPAWIGARTEIRPGAYIRGNVIIGADCVIGNACEFKNCLLMDRVQVPHFSYVGDSILGNEAHLGAGVVCSNLRLDQQLLVLHLEEGVYETGLKKFGAIIGEQAEVGCNSVLMPGTLLGKRSLVTPLTPFGGQLEEGTFAHVRPALKRVPRRD
jgi:NDP-sugar pyrophosphorylase family protein